MSTALDEHLGADLASAIEVIKTITRESTLNDVRRASRVTKGLRQRAEELATEPGEAVEWLTEKLYEHEAWAPFAEARRAIIRAQEYVRTKMRAASRRWYQEVGSDRRKTPEMRAKLAADRKRQREAKKVRAA